jgi:hypothetical protein
MSHVRITAAKRAANITTNLPILLLTELPPSVLINKKLNPAWKKYAAELALCVHEKETELGLPAIACIFDALNRFGGFVDEQSSAEGNVFGGAMEALAKDLGCLVMVADHNGKDSDRGLRGTSTKEQNAYFVWDLGDRATGLTGRRLRVKKMKNGKSEIGIKFHMEHSSVPYSFEAKSDEGTEIRLANADTLAVCFDGEVCPMADMRADDAADPTNLNDLDEVALTKLNGAINEIGQPLPPEFPGAHGMRGIHVDRWYERLAKGRVFSPGRAELEFKKLCLRLQRKGFLGVHENWVWIPLPK